MLGYYPLLICLTLHSLYLQPRGTNCVHDSVDPLRRTLKYQSTSQCRDKRPSTLFDVTVGHTEDESPCPESRLGNRITRDLFRISTHRLHPFLEQCDPGKAVTCPPAHWSPIHSSVAPEIQSRPPPRWPSETTQTDSGCSSLLHLA